MSTSKIEWTDVVWNPVRGCSKVSAGCTNCYAERQAARFSGPGQPWDGFVRTLYQGPNAEASFPRWTGRVELVPDALDKPLRWRKPRRVFVNSMSDLFHERVSNEDIAGIFGLMASAPQHTFQVLTKRPERMRVWCKWMEAHAAAHSTVPIQVAVYHGQRLSEHAALRNGALDRAWPLPNVWLGVSVEDQASADGRIPTLLETPAEVRWVSYEPALGPVDFSRFMWPVHERWPWPFESPAAARAAGAKVTKHKQAIVLAGSRFLDWIVVGGESGPGARPCDIKWIRGALEQCKAAGVPVFVKQLGAAAFGYDGMHEGQMRAVSGRSFNGFRRGVPKLRHPKGGDPLEWPEDLRVREFPAGAST